MPTSEPFCFGPPLAVIGTILIFFLYSQRQRDFCCAHNHSSTNSAFHSCFSGNFRQDPTPDHWAFSRLSVFGYAIVSDYSPFQCAHRQRVVGNSRGLYSLLSRVGGPKIRRSTLHNQRRWFFFSYLPV